MTEYVATTDEGHLDPERARLIFENDDFRFLLQAYVVPTTMIHVGW